MNNEPFLPGGEPVDSHALASARYRREDLQRIAAGANPSGFPLRAEIEPAWGLLYAAAGALGFFVHPSEAPMAMLLRNSRDEVQEAIHLAIPYGDIVSAELLLPRQPRTAIGKFFGKYSARPEGELRVVWKSGNEERRISFGIAKGLDPFAEALGSHIPVSRAVETGR